MAYEPEPRQWEQKDWLYEKYWGELLSIREIAEEVSVSTTTIGKRFDRHGIPRRRVSFTRSDSMSPYSGFYNGDENAQVDDDCVKATKYDSEKRNGSKPNWAQVAEKDPVVGSAATFGD